MKPNLDSSKFKQKSPLPTVRFAETEPLPRSPTLSSPMSTIRSQPGQVMYTVPNPHLQYQHQNLAYVSNSRSTLPNPGENTITHAMPRPPSILITRPKRLSTQTVNTQTSQTGPVTPSTSSSESRWSHTLLPTRNSVSLRSSGSPVDSHHSSNSAKPVKPVPAVLPSPRNPAILQAQYNPLQHYIPCLFTTCSTHYTAPYAGSMYYVPQGPYALTRLHGYCPRHATKDLANASTLCKHEWETLRQNAGRKTLGHIAAEFETFTSQVRDARDAEDAQLQLDLRNRVLGATTTTTTTTTTTKAKTTLESHTPSKPKVKFDIWDWRYTPRHCTSATCTSPPYSPYASHLYAFYHTARASTFTPLPTLCPSCATAEIAAFEQRLGEQWRRTCAWDEQWDEWFSNVLRDREMEVEFWEKVQEKEIREEKRLGSAGRVEKVGEVKVRGRRKSMFGRLIGSMTA